MNMPGFTADVSVYRTSNTYQAAYGTLASNAPAAAILSSLNPLPITAFPPQPPASGPVPGRIPHSDAPIIGLLCYRICYSICRILFGHEFCRDTCRSLCTRRPAGGDCPTGQQVCFNNVSGQYECVVSTCPMNTQCCTDGTNFACCNPNPHFEVTCCSDHVGCCRA